MSNNTDTDSLTAPSQPLARGPHPRYKEARTKAYQLETTIETAQKQYAAQLSTIIRRLQQQFYSKYGDKIQELEDLEEAIGNIQYSGMKNLKRQLTRMYLMADGDGQQGGGETSKKDMQDIARKLYTQYKQQYFPDDEYQQKRNIEARKLQMSIMGSMGGRNGNIRIMDSGGGAGMPHAMLANRSRASVLDGGGYGNCYSSDDDGAGEGGVRGL